MSQSLKDSVNKLVVSPQRREPLPAPQPAVPIAQAVGFAQPQKPAAAGAAVGVASPWIEQSRVKSAAVVEIVSTDGFTVLQVPAAVEVKMKDANGRFVYLSFVNG